MWSLMKPGAVVIALSFLQMTGTLAAPITYVSSTGSDSNPCTAAQPCATLQQAIFQLDSGGGQVSCLNAPGLDDSIGVTVGFSQRVTIDCSGLLITNGGSPLGGISLAGNKPVKIRNLTITGLSGGFPAIGAFAGAGGNMIIENCVVENFDSQPLDIEPNGPLNLVIRNTRISNSAAGILLSPQAGGSIKATLDHVVITGNGGGGIKADSTNGVVNLDLSDSEISNNSGNGINAVAGANQNIVSIKNSVIARNGAAGVQANGANAGVLLQTTLLDQNVAGATSVVSGGNMFTYGNNSIVGSAGSGFNHTAGLQ